MELLPSAWLLWRKRYCYRWPVNEQSYFHSCNNRHVRCSTGGGTAGRVTGKAGRSAGAGICQPVEAATETGHGRGGGGQDNQRPPRPGPPAGGGRPGAGRPAGPHERERTALPPPGGVPRLRLGRRATHRPARLDSRRGDALDAGRLSSPGAPRVGGARPVAPRPAGRGVHGDGALRGPSPWLGPERR